MIDGSNEIFTTGSCQVCPSDCSNPFDRVVVSYLTIGGTTVFWELLDTFTDPRPYTFTLQIGQSDNPDADDWTNVGMSVVDMFFAVDGEQRIFAMNKWQFYRVKLVTSKGTYYSEPTGLMGTLSHRDWRLAKAQMRSELVYMRNGDGQLGYLLKKRVAGPKCPHCLDPQTDEVTQPYCEFCHGTGFLCGYFFPIACVWADISPRTQHLQIDAKRGTVGGVICTARMCNTWMLGEGDVFIQKRTDDRFYAHSIQNISEYRGVPITANVELRLAAASDPIYDIAISTQLETLSNMKVGI